MKRLSGYLYGVYKKAAINDESPLADYAYYLTHHLQTFVSVFWDAKNALIRNKLFYKEYMSDVTIPNLYFEITNKCNAACVFCAYSKDAPTTGKMIQETFKNAIDEYIKIGGKMIDLTPIVGEVLLDPELFEKIRYATEKNVFERISVYSNGILLVKNDNYKRLVDSGITDFSLSFTGPDKQIYEDLYQVNAYDILMQGIKKLLAYNKEKGEKIRICFQVRSSAAPKELFGKKDFREIIKPYLSDRVTISFKHNYDNWGGSIKPEDLQGVMKMRRIPKNKTVPCKFLFEPTVLFDGSLRMCACRMNKTEFDELVVGNINQTSLHELFHGEKATRIRDSFAERNIPPICQDCSLYQPVTRSFLRKLPKPLAKGIEKLTQSAKSLGKPKVMEVNEPLP
ncbi:MAG: radical SAM protein [Chlorobiales bacterium]|jgi:MoaA/NifB/PqqE/SkfB family radical SAM enzyme|nr:radical SAM protein [Chlorobiales bacterium]